MPKERESLSIYSVSTCFFFLAQHVYTSLKSLKSQYLISAQIAVVSCHVLCV